jgi:hypothetical protein
LFSYRQARSLQELFHLWNGSPAKDQLFTAAVEEEVRVLASFTQVADCFVCQLEI